MAGWKSPAGLAICRQAVPQARVCVLSMRPHAELMQSCLAAGAKGYIVKDSTPAELVRAVRMIADGETYVDHRIAGALLRRRSLNASGRGDIDELSMRETEIVLLIAQGLSNKEISGSPRPFREDRQESHKSHFLETEYRCSFSSRRSRDSHRALLKPTCATPY